MLPLLPISARTSTAPVVGLLSFAITSLQCKSMQQWIIVDPRFTNWFEILWSKMIKKKSQAKYKTQQHLPYFPILHCFPSVRVLQHAAFVRPETLHSLLCRYRSSWNGNKKNLLQPHHHDTRILTSIRQWPPSTRFETRFPSVRLRGVPSSWRSVCCSRRRTSQTWTVCCRRWICTPLGRSIHRRSRGKTSFRWGCRSARRRGNELF